MKYFSLAMLIAALSASHAGAEQLKGAKLASQAKITLAKAEAVALAARPGKITDRELEKERGGSGLRYSFDVLSGGKTYEVGVDARTGSVLENGVDKKGD